MKFRRLRKCIYLADLKSLGYEVIAWCEPDGKIYCDIHTKSRIISGECCVSRGVIYGVKIFHEEDEYFLTEEIFRTLYEQEHGFLTEVHDKRRTIGYITYAVSLIFVICHIIIGMYFIKLSDIRNVADMYMLASGSITVIFVWLIFLCRQKQDLCGLDIQNMSEKMDLLRNGEVIL